MKIPRNLSGQELAQALKVLGYQVTRQSGSHLEFRGHHTYLRRPGKKLSEP